MDNIYSTLIREYINIFISNFPTETTDSNELEHVPKLVSHWYLRLIMLFQHYLTWLHQSRVTIILHLLYLLVIYMRPLKDEWLSRCKQHISKALQLLYDFVPDMSQIWGKTIIMRNRKENLEYPIPTKINSFCMNGFLQITQK